MALKYNYDKEDDVFTIYDSDCPPTETIEFSEFLNIDINKDKGIVGMEVFYASEFFFVLNEIITKKLLENADDVSVGWKNYRNNWIISLTFDYNGQKVKVQMPPLKKSEYKSPLIVSCQHN